MSGGLSRARAILLGTVVLGCLSLGGWGLYRMGSGQANPRDSFELVVQLGDAQDIEIGSPVRIRGVEAGQVVGVEIPAGDPDHVHLRLRLAGVHRERLFADARAQVASKGMLGGSQLAINPGSAKAGPLEGNLIPGEAGIDLQSVAVKLSKVADRADSLLNDVQAGKGTVGKLLQDEELYRDLKGMSKQAGELIGDGRQTLGSVRDQLDGMKEFVRSGNEAIQSIRQDADAFKGLPIIRNYVEDSVGALVRPQSERHREVYREDYLFEPGRAVLTADGRTRLTEAARWLNGTKGSNTDVVVASFADPKNRDITPPAARKLTQMQSEAVAEFLKSQNVARLSWISSRKVTALGLGQAPSPVVEKEALPPARIEVILFVQP